MEFFTNEKSTKHLQLCLDLKKLQDPPFRGEHELHRTEGEERSGRGKKSKVLEETITWLVAGKVFE